MKKIAFLILTLCVALTAYAADAPTSNMEILRAKMQADKRLLVASAMQLSDAEGKAFWPIYDAHQVELDKLNARIGKLIKKYADAYNKGSGAVSNDVAKELIKESLAIDEEEIKARRNTAAKMEKALSAAHAARYLQVENKIRAVLRYELAEHIPLAGVGAAPAK